MRLDQALSTAAGRLSVAGVSSPAVDARLIAAHLLGCAPMEVFAFDEEPAGFWELVARRELREPLQHILGVAPFGPLELEVGPGVFIPRPETETLADWAVRALGGIDKPLVVDLCTGSGALALYVAHYVPQVRVIGVELSDAALAYAERNARGSGVQLVQGDVTDPGLLAQLQGNVDLVVTNPPYVPEAPDLDREVYQDPHEAVFAGPDGMSVIDAMVPVIAGLLRPGGIVGIEHDDATSAQVQQALAGCGGFTDIAALKDLAGVDRFVTARRGE